MRKVGLNLLLLFIVGISIAPDASASSNSMRGPWDSLSANPLAKVSEETVLSRNYSYTLLNFYQEILSVVMISRCPMAPSCSNYSIQAIRKHGVGTGVLMTADRIYHEGSVQEHAQRVWIKGKLKFLDPVEQNDFWWHHEH